MTSEPRSTFAAPVKNLVLLLGTVVAGALSGCSTFDRDWEASQSAAPPAEGLVGRWEGTWTSEASGHTGGLRCIMSSRSDGLYEARYHATYRWCLFTLSFEYTVPMTAQKEEGAWKFQGHAELSCWIGGGEYEYAGKATATNFTATYRSSEDQGVFKMSRPR